VTVSLGFAIWFLILVKIKNKLTNHHANNKNINNDNLKTICSSKNVFFDFKLLLFFSSIYNKYATNILTNLIIKNIKAYKKR
jgi:hypothetical protein